MIDPGGIKLRKSIPRDKVKKINNRKRVVKIYTINKETRIDSPLKKSFNELNKHKRIKGYIFQAMKILGYGLRDIASICGYHGNNDFLLFVKYISVRHRMLIISPKFDFMRSKIENEIRKKLINEEKDSMEKAG